MTGATTRDRRTPSGALRTGVAIILCATAFTACGPAAPPPAGLKAIVNPSGVLGSTLPVSDSSGAKLEITLEQVVDPADGANTHSRPAAGRHFVAVKLSIKNTATKSYQNNANNETTVVTSNGQKLVADYNPIAGCGNFDNGQIMLKSGASGAGCVTFQVPDGEAVVTVHYGNTVFPGATAQWHVT